MIDYIASFDGPRFASCVFVPSPRDRFIQYTMTMLDDTAPVVRATAVRSLRALLGMVTSFPPSDSNIFLLYIFPALQVLTAPLKELLLFVWLG